MGAYVPEKVKEVLEWPAVLQEIVSRCRTVPGKEAAAAMAPLEEPGIRARLRKITHLKEMRARDREIDLSGVSQIGPLLDRTEKGGALTLEELAAVRSFVMASGRVRRALASARAEYPSLEEDYRSLEDLKELGDEIIPSITDSGALSDSRFPRLRELRDSIFEIKREIEKGLSEVTASKQGEAILQEKIITRRSDRYALLVKANMRGKLPGNVLDASSSGATLYIEPDFIRPRNNELILRERELAAVILRILAALSERVAQWAPQLRWNGGILAGLDLASGAARFSEDVRGSEPEISGDAEMMLIAARHPLLTLMNPSVVPNDVALGSRYRCLILSGANTGGKTVLLKTIGLCALMTLHGLHIPASPDSRMGIFTGLLADIGDDQNLSQSLSTFSGQLAVIREMLQMAGRSTLIIIDEIVVGTNPRQGSALARAILEELVLRDSCIVATTHYNELKELASRDGRFMNASVSFNLDSLKPDYLLHTGIPGTSYALEIARTCGLPESVLERAAGLLSASDTDADALIERMQRMEEAMREERDSLASQARLIREERGRMEAKELGLRRREQELKRGEGISFLDELREHRREIAETIRRLEHADAGEAWRAYETSRRIEAEVSGALKEGETERYGGRYGPVDPATLAPGDRVLVLSLEKEAEVASVDRERDSVTVLIGGNITSRYRFAELLSPLGGVTRPVKRATAAKPPREPEASGPSVPTTIQTRYNTVDLRGLRVHEALQKMESHLDGMVRNGINCAVVIHGHGTGALREAVRSALHQSPYAMDFRAGEQGEGGDGVTIVLLRR
ncbi:MAG: Smr/MutS family protein [Spirochaetes bacterium]|nr:Smr/MutS family protein [Spirochaetota bacterium]